MSTLASDMSQTHVTTRHIHELIIEIPPLIHVTQKGELRPSSNEDMSENTVQIYVFYGGFESTVEARVTLDGAACSCLFHALPTHSSQFSGHKLICLTIQSGLSHYDSFPTSAQTASRIYSTDSAG